MGLNEVKEPVDILLMPPFYDTSSWYQDTIVDILEKNICQIFVKYSWLPYTTPTLRDKCRSLLSFSLLTFRYFTSDSEGYFMLCYAEEFKVEVSRVEPFG